MSTTPSCVYLYNSESLLKALDYNIKFRAHDVFPYRNFFFLYQHTFLISAKFAKVRLQTQKKKTELSVGGKLVILQKRATVGSRNSFIEVRILLYIIILKLSVTSCDIFNIN